MDPTVKNYHWNDLTMGLFAALDAGADSVVLVNDSGQVVEGPGFNVFCVCDGVLITPVQGMLEGVTRMTVLEIAQSLEIPVQVRAVLADEFKSAQEAFISTSGGGVLPVTRVNGQRVGNGQIGVITSKIADAYWAMHKDPALNSPIAYA